MKNPYYMQFANEKSLKYALWTMKNPPSSDEKSSSSSSSSKKLPDSSSLESERDEKPDRPGELDSGSLFTRAPAPRKYVDIVTSGGADEDSRPPPLDSCCWNLEGTIKIWFGLAWSSTTTWLARYYPLLRISMLQNIDDYNVTYYSYTCGGYRPRR